MITSYDFDENIRAAMKRGASGYLLKSSSPDEIVRAIESVQQGGLPLDSEITKKMMAAYVGWGGSGKCVRPFSKRKRCAEINDSRNE